MYCYYYTHKASTNYMIVTFNPFKIIYKNFQSQENEYLNLTDYNIPTKVDILDNDINTVIKNPKNYIPELFI